MVESIGVYEALKKLFVTDKDGHITIDNTTITADADVTDRAARLLGVVDSLTKWGGTALTGRDITTDIKQLSDMEDVDKLVVIPKAAGKTTIRKASVAVNQTTTIYTVSAGKTFYLVSAFLAGYITAANIDRYGTLGVDTGGNGVFVNLLTVNLTALTGATNMPAVTATLSPSVPMPFSAGTVFNSTSSGPNCGVTTSIMGWEE
jgi:hypothetical protein